MYATSPDNLESVRCGHALESCYMRCRILPVDVSATLTSPFFVPSLENWTPNVSFLR